MLKKILKSKDLSFSHKIENIIKYFRLKRGARIQWKKQFKIEQKLHPGFKLAAEKEVEKSHRLYWRSYNKNINLSTIRICTNISGIANHKYIPEEVFSTDIDPTLNNTPSAKYLTYKSLYYIWFPGNLFPKAFFHNIDGEWLDNKFHSISYNDVKKIGRNLKYPVVFKPNRDSYGGKNIYFPESYNELMNLVESKNNYVVQEKIKQHWFFEQFNPSGLNTLRVNVYKSVKDNKHHIVNITLRMGVNGSLDNLSAGGIATLVRNDGFLNGFAIDKYGKKYLRHPDTGMEFNCQIPNFEGLKEISIMIAKKTFYARLIPLDFSYDLSGKWRPIEVNIFGATIRFAQYHGTLFFGEFTDEIHNYCLKNHWALK